MYILADFIESLGNLDSLFDLEEQVILHLRKSFQLVVAEYLRQLDETLVSSIPAENTFINRQARTIEFMFGAVNFERRCYLRPNGSYYFPLDEQLQLEERKRISPYFKSVVAKIGQTTTMRNTAAMINLASQTDISAWSVDRIIRDMADTVKTEEKSSEKKIVKRRKVENLVVEGDAFEIHKINRRRQDVHHYIVFESGLDGTRSNKVEFVGINQKKVQKRVTDYIEKYYRISEMTVFTASDGGPGYNPESMREIVPSAQRVEFTIDRYHFVKKIKQTFGLFNPLVEKDVKSVSLYDQNQLNVILDTFESQIKTDKELESLRTLRQYLARNWQFIKSPHDRGFMKIGKLGSIESSHRAYTYRMKKQGKVWSEKGLEAMLKLIEARVNGKLNKYLRGGLRKLQEIRIEIATEPLKTLSSAQLSSKHHSKHIGVLAGKIPVDAPTSSPIGAIAKIFSN